MITITVIHKDKILKFNYKGNIEMELYGGFTLIGINRADGSVGMLGSDMFHCDNIISIVGSDDELNNICK